MRVEHRYVFNTNREDKEIYDYLNKNDIKYTVGDILSVLKIYEDHPQWNAISILMEKHGIHSSAERVYSKQEISDAEWYRIRSNWRSEYPQPEEAMGFRKVTYDAHAFCPGCGCGLVQKDSFRLKRSPKWGKKRFLELYWVENELFSTDSVAETLVASNLSGFKILPVVHHKTGNPIENIKQIFVENTLKQGQIITVKCVEETNYCSQCGMVKYVLSGRCPIVFKDGVFPSDLDIVRGHEIFGTGHICLQFIMISKRMYKFFEEQGWLKDVIIEPIFTEEKGMAYLY